MFSEFLSYILMILYSLYMGCSDVSEFEHIYGQNQISTTPSCLYDPLFT